MALNWSYILVIGIGGFIGSIFRAIAVDFSNRYYGNEFAFGILFVNIVGSFLIGLLYAYFLNSGSSELLKAFLIVGFLGALTTFSTFALDNYIYLNSSLMLAIVNMALNLFGTLLAVIAGVKIYKLFA
ncbi:MAG: CrcB family protein [Sulfurospirillaceae bacterium]|jgi:CrcB protein|nr:CrcB family protein [Sulfurospirillaceae bacterium]MCK9546437.1 CrcB family protein [Sulfurospirillaceae bacterium]